MENPAWRSNCLVSIVSFSLVAFCLLQLVTMRFGRDQGIYAVVANGMLHGQMPYRDVWDFKPPGIYFVYALALAVFGRNEWGIRIFEAASIASLWPAFHVLSKKLLHSDVAGRVAIAVTAMALAQLEFWHSAQPETFGGVLVVWGAACVAIFLDNAAILTSRRSRIGWLLLSGVLFGAAGLMKPYLAGAAVVSLIWVWWTARGTTTRQQRYVWAFGLGIATCLPLGAIGIWIMASGAWNDFFETLFVFAPAYVGNTLSPRHFPSLVYQASTSAIFGFSALIGIGSSLTIICLGKQRSLIGGTAFIAGLAATNVIGIAMQAKFFPYHFAAVLPILALMAAPGLVSGWRWAWQFGRGGQICSICAGLFAVDAVAATRDLSESFMTRSWRRTTALLESDEGRRCSVAAELNSVADVSYAGDLALADWLRANVAEDEPIYIWGFEPFVYQAADRVPASRFIYNVPQRASWSESWARPALMRELDLSPPKSVAVAHADIFPAVTGNLMDSAQALRTFPALERLIRDHYEAAGRIDDFDVYLRKQTPQQVALR